jgi:hypothetical protein
MATCHLLLPAALAALGAVILPAAAADAADKISQDIPSPAACSKTVNAMGASMGHRADTSPDGKPIYHFVLRQNGYDYDVTCDAASGVVGDVTPRTAH